MSRLNEELTRRLRALRALKLRTAYLSVHRDRPPTVNPNVVTAAAAAFLDVVGRANLKLAWAYVGVLTVTLTPATLLLDLSELTFIATGLFAAMAVVYLAVRVVRVHARRSAAVSSLTGDAVDYAFTLARWSPTVLRHTMIVVAACALAPIIATLGLAFAKSTSTIVGIWPWAIIGTLYLGGLVVIVDHHASAIVNEGNLELIAARHRDESA